MVSVLWRFHCNLEQRMPIIHDIVHALTSINRSIERDLKHVLVSFLLDNTQLGTSVAIPYNVITAHTYSSLIPPAL